MEMPLEGRVKILNLIHILSAGEAELHLGEFCRLFRVTYWKWKQVALVQERHIPSSQVTVIHYGIEPQPFAQPHPEQHNAASPAGQAFIGSIGRLELRKGHA